MDVSKEERKQREQGDSFVRDSLAMDASDGHVLWVERHCSSSRRPLVANTFLRVSIASQSRVALRSLNFCPQAATSD